MRMKALWLATALAAPTLSAATPAFADDEHERTVKLSDIPEPARKALLREAKGEPIVKVELERQRGRILYEGHVKEPQGEVGIVVDASGQLVGRHSEEGEDEE